MANDVVWLYDEKHNRRRPAGRMIHITLPSYQTLTENLDPFKKYTVFDIHVNGAFHASVRYNVLYALHERLVENFGLRFTGPEFPPKKIWRSLDSKSLNERREGLAKYFQGVIQNPDIAKHPVLERAFLEFQVTSFSPTIQNVKLEIFLPDGRPTVVDCYSDDGTSLIMQKLCKALGMDEKHSSAFGLFLSKDRHIGEEDNGTTSSVQFDQLCVRWLKNFEAPYISQKLSNRESDKSGVYHKILVRRVTWDPSVEEPLLDDPGCVKVLYLQALNDLQRGVLRVSQDAKAKLAALHDQSCFKQFIRLCHLQPSYGYEVLAPVVSDFPSKDTECELKVGRRQIVLEYKENNMIVQSCLRSTRIRVWRVSHTDTNPNAMLFQIEYLVGKDEFNIVTLSTSQAVILSLFLQSIAAEILQDKANQNTVYKFDDSVQAKVIERLEASKANSIVSDDLSIKEHLSTGSENGDGYDSLSSLFKIISYQMPFNDDSFDDITDADL